MSQLVFAFDGALDGLPDDWTVATFDVRLRDPAEHLREHAANMTADFSALAGAYRAPGGQLRFRVGRSHDDGLPHHHQITHALRRLDSAENCEGLTLADVQTQRSTALAAAGQVVPAHLRTFG